MAKGSQFERDVCRELSLWWSKGESDSVFWRTHGSGARATVRTKKGKKTSGQYGDVCASEPSGQSLLKLITFSLKRGYSRCTPFDLLDKSKSQAKQKWEEWIEEAEQCCKDAGSFAWMIITKRDRRETFIVIPASIAGLMNDPQFANQISFPRFYFWIIRGRKKDPLLVFKLSSFFNLVTPMAVESMNKWRKNVGEAFDKKLPKAPKVRD